MTAKKNSSMNRNAKVDPDCRAEKSWRIVTDEFAICLTNNSFCQHRVDIEGLRLCFHHRRDQIINQTDAASYAASSHRES